MKGALAGVVFAVGCGGPVDVPNHLPPVSVDDTSPTVVSSTPCDACGGDCLVEELAYAVRYHVEEPIDYADPPPAGGPHNPCWATWGVHADPVPDDNFVHNLEHGGVVWLYDCEGCDADVAALEGLAADVELFALVTAYPDSPSPFAAVAWGWRLTTGCVDVELERAFYDEHVNHAPESLPVDPGEACM